MAAAGFIRARRVFEIRLPPRRVEVAHRLLDEVTAAQRPVAAHGEHRLPAAAGAAPARMSHGVEWEERVNGRQSLYILFAIVVFPVFVGVDPQVDLHPHHGSQRLDGREMLLHPHDAHAVTDAVRVQRPALRQEARLRHLCGMVRGPERERAPFRSRDPIQRAGEVGLDGDLLDVGDVAEGDQGLLIAAMDERLAPGGEEQAQPPPGVALHPGDEARQRLRVSLALGGGLWMLGLRAVGASVIATGERAAINQRQVHRHRLSCEKI